MRQNTTWDWLKAWLFGAPFFCELIGAVAFFAAIAVSMIILDAIAR